MTLPTTEQLNEKFEELAHADKEWERVWFWYGIAAYAKLMGDAAAEELGLDEKGGQQ
jgi:hypothetical protein